jgi:hypothetical protein
LQLPPILFRVTVLQHTPIRAGAVDGNLLDRKAGHYPGQGHLERQLRILVAIELSLRHSNDPLLQ